MSKPGRMPKGSQQWTPEQIEFLDAEQKRLGLRSRADVARFYIQAEIERRRPKQPQANGDDGKAA